MNQWKQQVAGFLIGVGISVVVGVAGELSNVKGLGEISLAGIAVTAIRSAATAVLTLAGTKVPGLS